MNNKSSQKINLAFILERKEELHAIRKALELCKRGTKITREGWNGKNMFVVYQKAYPEGIPINENTSHALGLPQGTIVKFRPYLMMYTAQWDCVPWVASQTDILAEDWDIFTEGMWFLSTM